MEVRINGRKYNTDTARYVGEYYGNDDISSFYYFHEELYKKLTGEFFIYGEGGAATEYSEHFEDGSSRGSCKIVPISTEEAKEWTLAHAKERYKLFFGEYPEEKEQ